MQRFRLALTIVCAFAHAVPCIAAAKPLGHSIAPRPTILWASDPVMPGDAALLWGSDFGKIDHVSVARLADGEGAGSRPLPTPALQATDKSVKCVIPESLKLGVFAVSVVTDAGQCEPVLLNRPDLWWCQGDLGEDASPGGWVRAFGKCLALPGARHSDHQVTLQLSGPSTARVQCVNSTPYALKAQLPDDLPPGVYEARVHNGFGGNRAWSQARRMTMRPRKSWPKDLFNVADFGADGVDGRDQTQSVASALSKAAENGGGVVYFPRGRYMITDTLVVPRLTVLRGQARDQVAIVWPDMAQPPTALVRGSNSFGLEDLTLYCSNYRHVIVADQGTPDAGDVFLRRVRVRADIYRGHLKPEDVHERFVEFQRLSTGGGDVARLGGRNVEVTDCDFYGSGRSMHLFQVRGARVSGNTFYHGRWGWYCYDGSDGLVLENNKIIGADLMSTGGSLNCYQSARSQNVYYAHNTLRLMHGWDREAMTTDAGYGAYYGGIVSATSDTIALAGDAQWKRKKDWTGGGVFILSGRGMGQCRMIAECAGRRVKLDRAWTVAPDATSVITITMMQRNYLFIGNTFEDAGIAIQYYGTSVHHIADGNRAARAGGFYNSGRWYRHYQPSWFCQFFNNEILEGNCYRFGANNVRGSGDSFIGTQGLQWGDNKAPLALCTIHRRNHLHNNARLRLLGVSASAPGVRDVVLDANVVENADVGIEIDGGCVGVLRQRNVFKNVKHEVRDLAEELRQLRARSAALSGQQKPVAHWDFEAATRLTVPDLSGNGFDATKSGDVLFGVDGVRGKGVQFDGNGYLVVPDAGALSFAEFSLTAWVKPKYVAGRFGLIAKRHRVACSPYVVALRDKGIEYGATNTAGKWVFNFTSNRLLENDAWRHVAVVTRQGKGIVLYIDGEEAGRKDIADELYQNADPVVLGYDYWGGRAPASAEKKGYYHGVMDEVKIWSRALSAQEVNEEFRRISPPR